MLPAQHPQRADARLATAIDALQREDEAMAASVLSAYMADEEELIQKVPPPQQTFRRSQHLLKIDILERAAAVICPSGPGRTTHSALRQGHPLLRAVTRLKLIQCTI